jgi:hypothetical protein
VPTQPAWRGFFVRERDEDRLKHSRAILTRRCGTERLPNNSPLEPPGCCPFSCTIRAPCRSVIRAAGQRATAARVLAMSLAFALRETLMELGL